MRFHTMGFHSHVTLQQQESNSISPLEKIPKITVFTILKEFDQEKSSFIFTLI